MLATSLFVTRAVVPALLALWAVSPAAAAEPVTGFVEVPGGKLWYEAQGTGTPLVLLHDGLLPGETWDGQIPAFSRLYRTIRYDRRGQGRSELPQAPFSDLADLSAVFETLQIGRAVLVGCSSGGELAVDFALAHPDRVEALVLVGPVVSGLPYSEHFRERGLANIRPVFQEQNLEKGIEAWVRDPYLIDARNTRAKERLRELLTRYSRDLTYFGTFNQPAERPAAGRLAEIRVPTLLVVGASDIPDVHAHSGALEAGISGARRVVLPGAGHLVHLEIPERFNETVLSFLRPGDAAAAWLRSLQGRRIAEEHRGLLDYDASAPLDVQEEGSEERGRARVVDLSYASPLGGRVPAFLVLPQKGEKLPAVVFVHPGQGDRSTFLEEAVELAGRGIVSLLIGAPHTREGAPQRSPFDPAAEYREWLQVLLDIRRGFDLLAARPEVDPARLAYVGHSLGATPAGILAAHEKRPIAWVLMAGYPSLTHAMTDNPDLVAFRILLTPEQQRTYVETLAPLDSVHWIGRRAQAKLLLQFARRDEYITPFDAEAYTQAAGEPKEVRWYDTDHFFDARARKDRVDWLTEALGRN